jgi:hypothetical protein
MNPSFERAGERFRRVAPKFFVPTLRVHVLGKDQRLEEREEHRENEMRREDETRKSGTDVRNPSVHIFARRRSWFSYL